MFVPAAAGCVDPEKLRPRLMQLQLAELSEFTGQETNMTSAGCLHMAPCRRASLQFLICQHRISVLL